ncbi:MAG: response regulator transcription factor [Crocinitomicaceae bacterium]|nr:response regulator transcription factor [Crocinitomicaceae bacterium]
MISCVIVDDEKPVRESIAKMLEMFCPNVSIKGIASNIKEAKTLIEEKKPEMVFLDVEMPGGSGFDLLESLENTNFKVIFTTAHAVYAIKAIKYAAMDYLLKPINVEELKLAVNKCIESKSDNSSVQQQIDVLRTNRQDKEFNFSKIALPTADGMEFFDVKDIIRCEADRAYCKFHMVNNKKVHISKPMSEYQDILSQSNFLKVHKSNIVNLNHVVKYIKGKGGDLVMSDGSLVNVAVRRKDDVVQALGIS